MGSQKQPVVFSLCLLAATALGACSGAAKDPERSVMVAPPTGASDVSSNTPAEQYFPLVDGTVYNYETQNGEGVRGILIARVHRTDQTHGALLFPSGRKRFLYSPQGVLIDPSGDIVLPADIRVGATFRGQNGGRATIDDTSVVIDVKAGSFRNCVRVVEQRGGDQRAVYTTTFCPDVGIVVIEAQSGSAYERAELVSAGPPVIFTDGSSMEGPTAP